MICSECRRELVVDLQQIAGQPMSEHSSMDLLDHGGLSLASELQIVRAGLDTVERRRRRSDPPQAVMVEDAPAALRQTRLMVDEHALGLTQSLHHLLVRWTDELADLTAQTTSRPPSAATIEQRAVWLLQNITVIERAEFAPMMHDDVRQVVRRIRQAIDRPPDRLYAGPCKRVGCDGDIWGSPGAREATCDRCSWRILMADQREWLRNQTHGHLATAALIADASEVLLGEGKRITASQIRGWGARGRLHQTQRTMIDPNDGHTRILMTLYRVGDVIALYHQQETDRAKRKGNRNATANT